MTPIEHNVSEELVRRLRDGDPSAFDAVYAAEKDRLYAFLLRLTRDASVAADLFQNVWLKLARHASALRADSNLRAWLFTVARREYLSFRRAQALDISRLLTLDRLNSSEASSASLDAQARELKEALDASSDADREILLLSHVEGIDSTELAEILGISGAAFRQRLVRARRRLRRRLVESSTIDRPSVLGKGVR